MRGGIWRWAWPNIRVCETFVCRRKTFGLSGESERMLAATRTPQICGTASGKPQVQIHDTDWSIKIFTFVSRPPHCRSKGTTPDTNIFINFLRVYLPATCRILGDGYENQIHLLAWVCLLQPWGQRRHVVRSLVARLNS